MDRLEDLVKQCQADTHRWFPGTASSISHHALALCGEAGEVANIVKKVERGSISLDEARAHLGEEAVDVLIYLCCLFAELGVDPMAIYNEKRAKNERRFGRDTTVGSFERSSDPGDGSPNGFSYLDEH